jgi:hypothetical protein
LFEIDRHLELNMKNRLAFREFGTCLGIACYSEQETEKERPIDLTAYTEAILASWEPYMELAMFKDSSLAVDDLRPITRVMYATALIPRGKFTRPSPLLSL